MPDDSKVGQLEICHLTLPSSIYICGFFTRGQHESIERISQLAVCRSKDTCCHVYRVFRCNQGQAKEPLPYLSMPVQGLQDDMLMCSDRTSLYSANCQSLTPNSFVMSISWQLMLSLKFCRSWKRVRSSPKSSSPRKPLFASSVAKSGIWNPSIARCRASSRLSNAIWLYQILELR